MNCDGSSQSCHFKNPTRKRNIRSSIHANTTDDNDSNESSVVKVPMIHKTTNRVTHKTHSFPKNYSTDDDIQPVISINFSSGESHDRKQLATSLNEIDTDVDRDSKAIFEKHLKHFKDGSTNDGLYHGMSAYTSYIEKKDTSRGNASSSVVHQGPIRASQNIRVTTRWDYHPELCKDYNETGYCGFGDSCKFIHDRTDYKSGWEIDKEFESNKQPMDVQQFEIHEHKHEIDDDITFVCSICRNHFENPIKTKCGHHFCEKCALDNYKKSGRCFDCNTQTYGIFNPATELIKKIKKFEEKRKAIEESEDEDFDPDDLLDIGNNSKDIINECENLSKGTSDGDESSSD